MAPWGLVFVITALAVARAYGEDSSLTFPELVRGDSRIVSGWEAELGQIPYQLSLRMVSGIGGVTSCGGTIIHPEWGLTAAHCTGTAWTLVIRAGAVNLTQPQMIFETNEYYNHPIYDDSITSVVQPNDIAIIKFGRVLEFNDYVQPIRIQRSSTMNRNYDDVRLVASGWGRTWTNGASPENMNWVYLRGTSNLACWFAFSGSSIIQDSTICARGYNESSQSTCQGDSGGPLTVVDDDGVISQVGVTSFVSGTGCHTDIPAGFIRPGHYHEWFEEVTNINFDWEYEVATTTTVEPEEVTSEPETEATSEPETDATSEPETEATSEPETEATSEPEATTVDPVESESVIVVNQ